MTDNPRRSWSHASPSSKTKCRLALMTLALGMSLAGDAVAQFRPIGPGPTGPGPIGPTIGPTNPVGPVTPVITPGLGANDPVRQFTPRLPPAVIDVPSTGIRPYGPVVIDNLDDYRRRLVTNGRITWTKQTKQPRRIAQRGGFDAPPAGEQSYVPNDVLLTISPSVQIPTLDAMARQHRLTRMESQDFALTGGRLSRWRINDGRPVAAVIRTLMADARILAAQPNYLYALQEDAPGQAKPERPAAQADSAQYALAKLRLPQAHAISKGDSVVVAVIDTSVDATHPELAGVIAATFDAMGTADKPQPHGTAMAGAIAAHGKLVGAAPGVTLLSVQAFGSVKSEGTSFNILKGLEWAAKQNANIVNMSFAGPADPALHVALAAARAKGIVLIAAAGNAGPRSRPLYPAADPNVIAVTATDTDDNLFARANRGRHIAVAAPGVDILVAAPQGGYQTTSGTSVAAAEVSGVVALMLERNRKLDPAEVRRLLTSTARDLGPAGPDDQFGAGLADAYGALTALGAKPTAEVSRAIR
jgi:subtilisin family serine protease